MRYRKKSNPMSAAERKQYEREVAAYQARKELERGQWWEQQREVDRERRGRRLNPGVGAPRFKAGDAVYDNFHNWTAEVVSGSRERDPEDGVIVESYVLRRAGNPPAGQHSQIAYGETYRQDSSRVQAAWARRKNPPPTSDTCPVDMDYNWWVQHYAPQHVRDAARVKHLEEMARLYPVPEQTVAERKRELQDEARYGRAMRREARRERRNPTTKSPTLAERVARAKREILQDVRAGIVPSTVGSFQELHDYVDANTYGGWAAESGRWAVPEYDESTLKLINAADDEIDAWIKAGGVRRKKNPALATVALTVLPHVVKALGSKVSAFNALPVAVRKARLRTFLTGKQRWRLGPAGGLVAPQVAKSDAALSAIVQAISEHGNAAVERGAAEAQKHLAANPRRR